MWHWYIRPDRCFASTWLLRLLVTFAVKAQVVQTWRRPPTSSNVTDIWRFTRSLISAQKPMSEPNFSPFPSNLHKWGIFRTFGKIIYFEGWELWQLGYCDNMDTWKAMSEALCVFMWLLSLFELLATWGHWSQGNCRPSIWWDSIWSRRFVLCPEL